LLIGPHLTPENQSELLARVRYRTKREIERIIGEFAPAPELPTRIELIQGEPTTCIEELDAAPARQRNTWGLTCAHWPDLCDDARPARAPVKRRRSRRRSRAST
jgi:hypothetical protein